MEKSENLCDKESSKNTTSLSLGFSLLLIEGLEFSGFFKKVGCFFRVEANLALPYKDGVRSFSVGPSLGYPNIPHSILSLESASLGRLAGVSTVATDKAEKRPPPDPHLNHPATPADSRLTQPDSTSFLWEQI